MQFRSDANPRKCNYHGPMILDVGRKNQGINPMKINDKFITFALLLLFLMGCTSERHVPVKVDYAINKICQRCKNIEQNKERGAENNNQPVTWNLVECGQNEVQIRYSMYNLVDSSYHAFIKFYQEPSDLNKCYFSVKSFKCSGEAEDILTLNHASSISVSSESFADDVVRTIMDNKNNGEKK
jgi:hypothetical protein